MGIVLMFVLKWCVFWKTACGVDNRQELRVGCTLSVFTPAVWLEYGAAVHNGFPCLGCHQAAVRKMCCSP
jgi:hypothetical protein